MLVKFKNSIYTQGMRAREACRKNGSTVMDRFMTDTFSA